MRVYGHVHFSRAVRSDRADRVHNYKIRVILINFKSEINFTHDK